MTRRNALDRLRNNPQAPISSIPLAQRRKRSNRSWDQVHRGISYFIPTSLNEQAKDLRASILSLAQNHITNTSNIAAALIAFSLTHVRQGKLVVEPHPNADRRKMALIWEEVNERPQKIPQPIKRVVKEKTKELYLNYRWGRDVDTQIKGLAGDTISPGEVVVFLLSYALAAYKRGRLMLKEEAAVVTQKVRSTW
ncbi:MAG: hypothetical protein EHM33_07665 [Chloroflexi bacterium]|nr:MAG: hypothetical protein EHM33_07665 [Chloroflexota bacterium]